jgi:aspartate/tyrosine/aromatic aminotransferase
MFDTIEMAPPDSILGITDAFNKDANPRKINLSVGVYKDASGKTPVLATVKEAERRLLAEEATKSYKPIDGDPVYGSLVRDMLFGKEHAIVTGNRSATSHTPGGTGALRVAGDFIRKVKPGATVWLSDPTWANHAAIFNAASLPTKTYAYFDAALNGVNIDKVIEALKQIPAGDVVLLHGCCHNPTGADPSTAQWSAIGKLLAERGVLPLVDFAYQGFADGLKEDAAGLLALTESCKELLICSSFSKNFGLYNERVGALTVVAGSADAVACAQSQIKVCIRANYSNPPSHGASIVRAILSDPTLAKQWDAELKDMRDRINGMRHLFVKTLAEKGVKQDMSFIIKQRGMFSFSGLTKEQVDRLKKEYAIYIVGSGRINVAGMTESNMDPLCQAIATVM